MKPLVTYTAVAIPIFLVMFTTSCRKDDPPPPPKTYKSPVALAGQDFTIYLPREEYIFLDGSASYHPDRVWINYRWTQLTGPSLGTLSVVGAKASALVQQPATYSFELKVVDTQQKESRDTIVVTATLGLACNPGAATSELRTEFFSGIPVDLPFDVSIGKDDERIAFAGGRTDQDDGWGGADVYTDGLVVFTPASKALERIKLSLARARIGIAVTEKEVFCAGGILEKNVTDVVDIYNLTDKSMTKAKLSVARSSVAVVTAGELVFFAGGRDRNNVPSDVVDIFDRASRSWSTAKLSSPRSEISATVAGNKVLFSGGSSENLVPSDRIDIYDLATKHWIVSSIASPRIDLNSAVLGSRIVFAGGYDIKYAPLENAQVFNTGSMTTNTTFCLPGRDPIYMVFGQNLLTATPSTSTMYYLGDRFVAKYNIDDAKMAVAIYKREAELACLFSFGGQLYGLAQKPGGNIDNWYVASFELVKINF